MKKGVFSLIVLMSCLLCVPCPGVSKMTAMTDAELGHLTGQKGIAPIPGGVARPLDGAAATASQWAAVGAGFSSGATALCQLGEDGLPPLDAPMQWDVALAGDAEESLALSGFMLAAGAAGLINPLVSGFLVLGAVPGAFDVSLGPVSVESSGTIEVSFHP